MRGHRLFLGVILIAVGPGDAPAHCGRRHPGREHVHHEEPDRDRVLGASRPASTTTSPGQGVFNSDLAFWGNTAVQGTYEGFRMIDISNPANPIEIVELGRLRPAHRVRSTHPTAEPVHDGQPG